MIGKQNRDTLYFSCIFEDTAVSHIVYKKTQLRVWGERGQFKSVQVRTGVGRVI